MVDSLESAEESQKRSGGIAPRRRAFWMIALGASVGFGLGVVFATALSLDSSGTRTLYDEALVTSLFEKRGPAVVEISVTRERDGIPLPGTSAGSGFLVDDQGHIVTNDHVVRAGGEVMVKLIDGRSVPAVRLGSSPADDLALLKVDASDVRGIDPLPLADSDRVTPGQMAIAIGSPFRQFNSVAVGVVSGTGRGPTSVLRRPIPDMIQTDAPLNPGNSGGPLLNSAGEVIGVNSAVRTGTTQRLEEFRIGFAVPSNTLRDLMPELLESRQVRRPWLGIGGQQVPESLATASGLPDGVLVLNVFPSSPAEVAGLVPFPRGTSRGVGDVITAVDGRAVTSVEEMVSYFNSVKPGEHVTLSVFRDSRTIEIGVTLAEWPDT